MPIDSLPAPDAILVRESLLDAKASLDDALRHIRNIAPRKADRGPTLQALTSAIHWLRQDVDVRIGNLLYTDVGEWPASAADAADADAAESTTAATETGRCEVTRVTRSPVAQAATLAAASLAWLLLTLLP